MRLLDLMESSLQASSIKPNKEYVLKVSVIVLFLVIVVGVSLIFHFYHKQLYVLKMGAQIQFNEITRHIDVGWKDKVKPMFCADVSGLRVRTPPWVRRPS